MVLVGANLPKNPAMHTDMPAPAQCTKLMSEHIIDNAVPFPGRGGCDIGCIKVALQPHEVISQARVQEKRGRAPADRFVLSRVVEDGPYLTLDPQSSPSPRARLTGSCT